MRISDWSSDVCSSDLVDNLRKQGQAVAHLHLRHIWPLPRNLGALLDGFDRILVPEMNGGQLVTLLRSEYLVPAESLSKVTGKPFKISEIETAALARLESCHEHCDARDEDRQGPGGQSRQTGRDHV